MIAVARRRVLAAALLAVLAGDVLWGPAGCDSCTARAQRTAVTR